MRLVLVAAAALLGPGIWADSVTVLSQGRTTILERTLADDDDLWVTPADLPRVNGFTMKAEGACLGDVCVAIDQHADSTIFVTRDGQGWINVSELAHKLGQSFIHDSDAHVWSFAEVPAIEASVVASGMAPDFETVDRAGNEIRLSDFRGKKILLLTWASWCGCRTDLGGWQSIYSELKDKGFEIISVAEDTGGEDAAGRWFDASGATFTQIIDQNHLISRLYNMVNVPTGVWIDEQGRIARPNETAYSKDIDLRLGGKSIQVNGAAYVAALRDWVEKGDKSEFAIPPAEISKRLTKRAQPQAQAEAAFQLGAYFYRKGDDASANRYWSRAQALRPDSWNYHRQAWSFTPTAAGPNWMTKFLGLGEAPYYAPFDGPYNHQD